MWIYKRKKINDLSDLDKEYEGFVYKITNTTTKKFYIGKKSFFHSRKTKISLREKKETKSRKVYKRTLKESDWKTYYGSCESLKEDIKLIGVDKFKREILEFCCTKKYLNFCELEHQIKNDVLKSETYNGNILGKYYNRDMENCKE